jgi:imidazolonepropionase-like amidohydrolase
MRNTLPKRATALVLAFLPLLPLAKQAAAQNVAITGVRIVVGNGPVYENVTIIVRDGKIAAVTGGAVQIPAGLATIDGKGMSAMPGFIGLAPIFDTTS